MKNKKLLKAGISLLLVGVVGVGATLAFLTDKTDPVTNTFTIGKGYNNDDPDSQALVLDETNTSTEVDEKWSNFGDRTISGNTYEFIPGGEYIKDPTVHLRTDSVDSYIFVKITGLDEMLAPIDGTTYYNSVDFNGDNWIKVDDTAGYNGIYVYVNSSEATEGLVVNSTNLTSDYIKEDNNGKEYYTLEAVFESLEPNNAITTMPSEGTQLGTISVKACAVQAKNNTYANALEQAKGVLN